MWSSWKRLLPYGLNTLHPKEVFRVSFAKLDVAYAYCGFEFDDARRLVPTRLKRALLDHSNHRLISQVLHPLHDQTVRESSRDLYIRDNVVMG
jgi:hypothetical protein